MKPGTQNTAGTDGETGLTEVAQVPAGLGGNGTLERVRHVNCGTEYEVLGEAEAQISNGMKLYQSSGAARVICEGERLIVYRCPETSKLWCRFPGEFRDGRFETIANALPSGWRTMADCPSDGRQVWVFGGRYTEPTLRAADGSYWRSATAAGLGRPTHWHPEMKPLAPASELDIAGAA